MNKEAHCWIDKLGLLPHREGGFFKEVLRSNDVVETDRGSRAYYTSIYFLLTHGGPSHFHSIQSDEVWYYHAGAPLTVHILHPNGGYEAIKVGPNADKGEVLQAVVPKGRIFGSSVETEGGYSVASCMCSPGFDYADFKLYTKDELLPLFPNAKNVIEQLAYDKIPQ
ncbi:cupin [Trypanosoma grayi]|uniref:cupin n=1 Tax=Trypanosoma grayi TaxID=71804 RepID=UPI0004F4B862|nr:cupin [Trypanosoma grayi]KEG06529.1 cupin [Trypanosoma grayi]